MPGCQSAVLRYVDCLQVFIASHSHSSTVFFYSRISVCVPFYAPFEKCWKIHSYTIRLYAIPHTDSIASSVGQFWWCVNFFTTSKYLNKKNNKWPHRIHTECPECRQTLHVKCFVMVYGVCIRQRSNDEVTWSKLENHFPAEVVSFVNRSQWDTFPIDGGLSYQFKNCQVIVSNDWLTRPHVPFNHILFNSNYSILLITKHFVRSLSLSLLPPPPLTLMNCERLLRFIQIWKNEICGRRGATFFFTVTF